MDRRIAATLTLLTLLVLSLRYGPLNLLQFVCFMAGHSLLSLRLALSRDLVDTSWHGQAEFIMRELKRHPLSSQVARLVVDIGAHDGVWQSNSHVFLQAGWRGLLIEPHERTYSSLQRNVGRRFPNVRLVRAAVTASLHASPGRVVTRGWLDGTENRVDNATDCDGPACVTMLPLPLLLAREGVPRRFAFLSLDVEWGPAGTARALRAMLAHGYRPEILCVENAELFARPFVLEPAGYRKLLRVRYDTIFRLNSSLGSSRERAQDRLPRRIVRPQRAKALALHE